MSQFWEQYLQRGWSILRIYAPTATAPYSCTCPSGDECESPGKHSPDRWSVYQHKHVPPQLARVWFRNPSQTNVAIVTGLISNLIVIDEDTPNAASPLNLPPTLTASTHSGRKHYYFQHPFLSTSQPLPTSIRLIPDVDLKGDGGYVVAPPSRHASGESYTWINPSAEVAPFPPHLLSLLPRLQPVQTSQKVSDDEWERIIHQGERDVTLTRLAGSLFGRGLQRDDVLQKILDHNRTHVEPPLPESDIRKIVFGIARSEEEKKQQSTDLQDAVSLLRDGTPPTTLEAPAYYGLAGEILRAIDPYIEPCHASVLVSFLTAFGNKVGRSPYTQVGPQTHHTNLFTLIFGESGISRKGVSWSTANLLLQPPPRHQPDPSRTKHIDFSQTTTQVGWRAYQGISSGEGMIYQVRDARPAQGRTPADPGVEDKRKLFYEAEFGSVIRKAKGESSILWQTLRNFFDSGDAENNPRHEQLRSTGAHVSIVGNITPSELRNTFPSAERTTGTANRFLWIFAQRGKSLPEGDPIPPEILSALQAKVDERVRWAQTVGLMTRDEEAAEYWSELYLGELSKDEEGPLRDLTSRGKPIILRLSMIYALLDQSLVIRKRHIDSALAIWHYSKMSIEYLYGTSAGTPIGNRILNYLELCPEKHATRTQIVTAMSGYSTRDLDQALDQLCATQLIEEFKLPRTSSQKRGPLPVRYRILLQEKTNDRR